MTAIFTVLQARTHDRNRVRLCATLIAAETDTEAEAIWRLWAARLIEAKLLRHAFINANAADRVKLCSACDIEILDIEAFEHWRRIATNPYHADGEQYPAVWREIHSETPSANEILARPEDEAETESVQRPCRHCGAMADRCDDCKW